MKVGTDGVLLGAWAHGGTKILDVGTGTGLIALMMAQRYPLSAITAIDIDEGAVCQALENVQHAGASHRIGVTQQSVQTHDGQYDSIVSNPPFFIDSLQAPDVRRSIARHASTLTYAELMEASMRLLKDDGELSVIVPYDYRKRMENEAIFVGFFQSRLCAIHTMAGRPARRYLMAFRKHPCQREVTSLTIGDSYYQELTRDFYL